MTLKKPWTAHGSLVVDATGENLVAHTVNAETARFIVAASNACDGIEVAVLEAFKGEAEQAAAALFSRLHPEKEN